VWDTPVLVSHRTGRRPLRAFSVPALFVAAAFCASACTEPIEFAEWTLPVAASVPVREYQVAPVDGRGADRIQIVTDLVISDDTGDGAAAFFNPRELVVDEEGRIYVLDAGNHRVQVAAHDTGDAPDAHGGDRRPG
jgi:hypothetical protein